MSQQNNDDFEHDLEAAIFRSLYVSRSQRLLRLLGLALIAGKHGLRGLFYVWPLTLLFFVDLPGAWALLKLLLLSLAVAAWLRFVYGSVRDDYDRFIKNRILKFSEIRQVL